MSSPPCPLKILVDLRPALAGHAGIPQETRMLFSVLCSLTGNRAEGLIQHSGRLLARGLPSGGTGAPSSLSPDQQLNRLGRVVISLEEDLTWVDDVEVRAHTVAMALWCAFGGTVELSRFDARHFRDFLWRRFFARTLPPSDFDVVTQAGYRIARMPWTAMHRSGLFTGRFGPPLYPRLDTADFDMMIAETPYPATVSKNTQLVVRYHDAIPVLMPDTIAKRGYHQASHYRALQSNVKSGAWFVCVSESTRRDLLSIFPQAESRSLTIYNMVSRDYFDENSRPDRVTEIIRTRLSQAIKPPLDPSVERGLFDNHESSQPPNYLLMVSTIEPRKNHLTVLSAWEALRAEVFPTLKLVIVGETGWHHEPILQRLRPWMEHGELYLLSNVASDDLRLLYKHASATVCPSLGEGFDFSGVEAMKSGGAVIASRIPVHDEIYADAAEFFDPYSSEDLREAIRKVIDPAHRVRRDELIARGAVVARRYDPEVILPQWESFLKSRINTAVNP
jgi:glycosyltransferase involved in cell wall biosynthesis